MTLTPHPHVPDPRWASPIPEDLCYLRECRRPADDPIHAPLPASFGVPDLDDGNDDVHALIEEIAGLPVTYDRAYIDTLIGRARTIVDR